MPPRNRTVVEDPEYQDAARRIEPDARRLDAIMESVIWRVSRAPGSCPEVAGTILRVAHPTREGSRAPRLRVFFSVDDENQCTLRYVELYDPEPSE
jgi:hypothetical protein